MVFFFKWPLANENQYPEKADEESSDERGKVPCARRLYALPD